VLIKQDFLKILSKALRMNIMNNGCSLKPDVIGLERALARTIQGDWYCL
jgi:hypothetical protein